MNFLRTLPVARRLALGFGLVLFFLAGVAGLSVRTLLQSIDRLHEIVQVNGREARLVNDMQDATNRVVGAVRDLVIVDDAGQIKALWDGVQKDRGVYDETERKLGEMFAALPGTTAREKELFAKVQQLKAVARPLITEVAEAGRGNHADQAALLLTQRAKPALAAWLSALNDLSDLEDGMNDELARNAQDAGRLALVITLVLAGLALATGALCAWGIARSITGELGGEPAYAADIASRIAQGDLAMHVEVREGDATSLIAAMGSMREQLGRIVSQVRLASDSIATGSGQIAIGNADLSQRTEEQASNLQQTAASMEQLTATVQQNSDTARQAHQLALSASSAATLGGEVVGRVVATMEEIAASSRRINDIIGVIDGIAFQTNILALNAAVEAARAGEQGRGFAVVAGEVRTLAQRSGEAAREIKSLIGASVEKVEAGTRHAGDAGQSMAGIVGQVQRVSDLIAEISAASTQQSSGIGQVGDAVTQLDQVTQQNAALVEESAAAAESLRQQAATLAEAVSVFRVANA